MNSSPQRFPEREPVRAPAAVPQENRSDEPASALAVWHFLCKKYDADGDGSIARGEYGRGDASFDRLDADGDERITPADFDERFDGVPRVENFVYGEGGPEVGDPAPDLRLQTTGGEPIELASFRGKTPVALIFGSFT